MVSFLLSCNFSLLFINNLNLMSRNDYWGCAEGRVWGMYRGLYISLLKLNSIHFLNPQWIKEPFTVGPQVFLLHVSLNLCICLSTRCHNYYMFVWEELHLVSFVVLNPSYILEPFWELSKILIFKPLQRWIKSETLGIGPRYQIFQYLKWFQDVI